jgi:hypothetical protein
VKRILSLEFRDTETNDDAWLGVRVTEREIGLTLSLKQDSDVEVFFPVETCKRLIEALEQASLLVGAETQQSE